MLSIAIALAFPYRMYWVAWFDESRLAPIWRGQSKAFLPGDYGLSIAVAAGIVVLCMGEIPEWVKSFWWVLPFVAAGVSRFAYHVGREVLYDEDDYVPEAWNSPSKRYHDVVMLVYFPVFAVLIVVPAYAQSWVGEGIAMRIVGVLGVVMWALGLWWDDSHDEVPNDNQHPKKWKKRQR